MIAYLKAHRPHVLFNRLLDHKNAGGTIGGPGQQWMKDNAHCID